MVVYDRRVSTLNECKFNKRTRMNMDDGHAID